MQRDPGFTLIEMLIVVTLIGVLVAVGYPQLSSNSVKAKKNLHATARLQIETQLQLALFDNVITTSALKSTALVAHSTELASYFSTVEFPVNCTQGVPWIIDSSGQNIIMTTHSGHE